MSRFNCKRVIDIPDDLRVQLVSAFENDLNSNMVSCFQKQSSNRDTALYYIVYFDTVPLFFFSLRTTMIYSDQVDVPVEKKNSSDRLQKAVALLNEARQEVTEDNLRDALRRLGESPEVISGDNLAKWLKVMNNVLSYRRELQDPNSLAVFKSAAPCLELVDFCRCTTEESKECQKLLGMDKGLGGYIFYTYIADIARKVYNVTSCEYLVLYAADNTLDYSLVRYYSKEYGFVSSKEFKTVKVWYDISCPLLILNMRRMLEDSDYYRQSEKCCSINDIILQLESEDNQVSIELTQFEGTNSYMDDVSHLVDQDGLGNKQTEFFLN